MPPSRSVRNARAEVTSMTGLSATDNAARPIRMPLTLWQRFDHLVTERLKVEIKRMIHARELIPVTVRTEALKKSRFVLITTLRNEAFRLPYFLQYYRDLGVEHFIIVDNESDDTVHDLVREMDDVSIWIARGSYKKSRYGVVWMNHLLSKYCDGKWIMNADPDEFLVYRDQENCNLPRLAERLERGGVRGLATVTVDMYSDRPIEENIYKPGQNPLEVCPYFDAYGYRETVETMLSVKHVRGGPRARIFFGSAETSSMLQKTVFVKWKWYYAFTRGSACEVWPPNLADARYADQSGMPGALLHFKFVAQFVEKVVEEQQRKQHTDEYNTYSSRLESRAPNSFMFEGSRRFEGWRSFVEAGILTEPAGR
jgi:hypothetical protein